MNEKTTKNRDWEYLLPDGRTASNMAEACAMLGRGSQGFRALVRKGIVKKVFTGSKTKRYEDKETKDRG